MPSSEPNRIRRAVLLLVLLLPLLAGAIYVGIKPGFDSTSRTPRVAIVAPDTAAGGKLASDLAGTPNFRWQTDTADSAAKRLSNGSLLAVVTIPEKFGSTDTDTAARRVTVVPGRHDLDAATYAALVQDVSAGASKIGVSDLLVGVAKAQGDLANAQFTATVINAGVGVAGDAVDGAFGSVDALVKQAGPVLANATSMLSQIQQINGTVTQVGDMLTTAGTSLHGVNLTLGDIQNGASAVGDGANATAQTLRATAPVRAELRAVITPIAGALSAIPGTQQMSTQLDSLLNVVGGPADPQTIAGLQDVHQGTQLIVGELNNLSALLGAKVDAHTQLADVLTLGANRLRALGAFLQQGQQTISQVVGQVSGAAGQLPSTETNIKSQLAQFKAVTNQLSTSLNEGSGALSHTGQTGDTAGTISNAVQVTDGGPVPGGLSADSVARAVLVLLVGALLIALGRAWAAQRLTRRGGAIATTAASVVGALATAGIGLAVLGSVPRADSAFVVLVVAALALSALAIALLRILGDKAGLITWVVLIGAGIVLSAGLHGERNPVARFIARLLPGSYATTGLGDAAAYGIGSDVVLPLTVLTVLGILALAAFGLVRAGQPTTARSAAR
jgi:uncharacterized phage infection (PIP) family protein YhgE